MVFATDVDKSAEGVQKGLAGVDVLGAIAKAVRHHLEYALAVDFGKTLLVVIGVLLRPGALGPGLGQRLELLDILKKSQSGSRMTMGTDSALPW